MRLSWPSFQLNNHSTIQLHGIVLIAGLLPKSPSNFPWQLSACLTSLTVFLPQLHDRSCYGRRRTLAPPSLWLHKHPDLPAYQFTHSTDLWHQSRPANISCAWSWRLRGINPAIHLYVTLSYSVRISEQPQEAASTASQAYLHTMFVPQPLQTNVGQCLQIDDTFLLQDYDLLVTHLCFLTSFDTL